MAKDNVLTRVATGAAVGGAIGGAVGAVYGTYDAIRHKENETLKSKAPDTRLFLKDPFYDVFFTKRVASLKAPFKFVPGLLKIRHIGQTTLGSAAVFSLFLAAGTLIRSH
ncbi:unnamed protein product [Sphenostylis stenocarpa]|uniref:Uncharacterized protein n=1 Tax=Sphenostylis stenocarpa TaxID=92480 RepID=A0AA86SL82_9FABA|nr:unnamed protein product [Sphenostylis stenocarpa]